ncbi:FMN-binding protein [Anaerocolumna sp. MB42-C2]|uniref:FMN-binding protein n=1 Tax=Anaerocolumna sp. MB42-C2 TaxID=3070997 RepID=UPI0027DF16B9|nr:FMN-binding protein [Anaerocolumna sp. MB42-C2]WMJ85696.1 FMN-binding protein [Anaerocolumna sp. MB42-C2]
MNKNKKKIGIVSVVIIILLAVIICGFLIFNLTKKTSGMDADNPGAIDLTGYSNSGDVVIKSASYLYTGDGKIDGYLVTVSSKGYNGNILMDITFDNTGNTVKSINIKDQKESEGYGDKITDNAFLIQFMGITAPISLKGQTAADPSTVDSEDAQTTETGNDTKDTAETETTDASTSDNTTEKGNVWADGTYEAEEAEFDDQGYKDKVTLTIQNNKITEVTWDAYNDKGELKSVLSADGAYEMTEHGPTWQEQSIAIANFLIENQSVDAFSVNKDGITDSVSGASISINDFISLVKECLTKAAPVATLEDTLDNTSDNTAESLDSNTKDTAENSGSTASEVTSTKDETKTVPGQIDAVSGATISSTAIVNGINQAQSFIKDFVMAK